MRFGRPSHIGTVYQVFCRWQHPTVGIFSLPRRRYPMCRRGNSLRQTRKEKTAAAGDPRRSAAVAWGRDSRGKTGRRRRNGEPRVLLAWATPGLSRPRAGRRRKPNPWATRRPNPRPPGASLKSVPPCEYTDYRATDDGARATQAFAVPVVLYIGRWRRRVGVSGCRTRRPTMAERNRQLEPAATPSFRLQDALFAWRSRRSCSSSIGRSGTAACFGTTTGM